MSQGAAGPRQSVVVQQSPSTSGVAMAGLIFSILGWFTCGLLCIPGAALSFFGLFSRGPKGAAIAGLIVGFPGVFVFLFFGFAFFAALLAPSLDAARKAADKARSEQEAREQVSRDGPIAETIPAESEERGETPDSRDESSFGVTDELEDDTRPMESETEPEPEPQDEPESDGEPESEGEPWRTWTSADGKFSVEAKFVEVVLGRITLEKRDGSTVDVKMDALSEADQAYVREIRGY